MATTAYDYQKQEWLEGDEAEALYAEQEAKHRALLADPAYRKFIGLDK